MPDATEAAVERMVAKMDGALAPRYELSLAARRALMEAIREELAAADRVGYVRALERVGCMWLSVCGRPDTCPRCKMLAEAGTTGPSQSG